MKKKMLVIGLVMISIGVGMNSMAGLPGCKILYGQTVHCADGVAF